MKKLTFCLAVLLTSCLSYVSAQVQEYFELEVGTSLEGIADGVGWDGPWTKVGGDDNQLIAVGGVTSAALASSSSGNHLALTQTAGSAGERYYRSLASPIVDNGGVYYLSYYMKTSIDNEPAQNGSVNFVMLCDAATLAASGPGGQLVQFGRVYNKPNIGVLKGGTSAMVDSTDARDGHYVVAKIYMSGDSQNETICVFVDPTADYADLDTANANLITTKFNLNNGFNAIGIKIEGGGALTGQIDEVKLVEAVVPKMTSDNFNAEAGTAISTTEVGDWGGAWEAIAGDIPQTVEGGISNPTLLKKTSGNHISIDYTGQESRLARPLSAKFGDDGSTYYVSFSTKSITGNANTVSYIMLCDDSFAASGPGGQLVQIGKSLGSSTLDLGVGTTFTKSTAAADEAHLVVAKIMTSGDAGADSIALFIDPQLSEEPSEATISHVFGAKLNNGFTSIGIKVSGTASPLETMYDDIMVGFNYASVIPCDLLEEAPAEIIARDDFSYTVGAASLAGLGDNANGWAGAWELMDEADSSTITDRGLLNESLLKLSKAPYLTINSTSANNRYYRLFETAITPDNDFWFAFNMTATGNMATASGLILTDTTASNKLSVIVGKQYGNKNIFVKGAGGTVTGKQLVEGEASWLVGQMKVVDGAWKMNLWVDPSYDVQPDAANADIKEKSFDGFTFQGIILRAEGNLNSEFIADDIIFGNNFNSVIPADAKDVDERPADVVESFDYTGDLNGANGGIGFAGAYKEFTSNGGCIVADEGVSNTFVSKATVGPSLHFGADVRARISRGLQGTYGDCGRSYWVGWWQYNYGSPAGNVSNFVLADTATMAATGAGGTLVQMGKSWQNCIAAVGANTSKVDGYAWDTAHFYVAYVETNGSATNDKVYLFIDPALDQAPVLDSANAVVNKNLSTWNGIGFKVEGPAGNGAYFDEVRIAKDYENIIPDNLEDIVNGINDLEMNKWSAKVYPNPSSSLFNVELELDKSDHITAEVFALDGRLVKRVELSNQMPGVHTISIDLTQGAELNSGLYLLKVSTANKAVTKQLIFQK